MSRQNKQAKKKQIAVWVTSVHAQGNKIPRTKKLSSDRKGKCVVKQGKRVSINQSAKAGN